MDPVSITPTNSCALPVQTSSAGILLDVAETAVTFIPAAVLIFKGLVKRKEGFKLQEDNKLLRRRQFSTTSPNTEGIRPPLVETTYNHNGERVIETTIYGPLYKRVVLEYSGRGEVDDTDPNNFLMGTRAKRNPVKIAEGVEKVNEGNLYLLAGLSMAAFGAHRLAVKLLGFDAFDKLLTMIQKNPLKDAKISEQVGSRESNRCKEILGKPFGDAWDRTLCTPPVHPSQVDYCSQFKTRVVCEKDPIMKTSTLAEYITNKLPGFISDDVKAPWPVGFLSGNWRGFIGNAVSRVAGSSTLTTALGVNFAQMQLRAFFGNRYETLPDGTRRLLSYEAKASGVVSIMKWGVIAAIAATTPLIVIHAGNNWMDTRSMLIAASLALKVGLWYGFKTGSSRDPTTGLRNGWQSGLKWGSLAGLGAATLLGSTLLAGYATKHDVSGWWDARLMLKATAVLAIGSGLSYGIKTGLSRDPITRVRNGWLSGLEWGSYAGLGTVPLLLGTWVAVNALKNYFPPSWLLTAVTQSKTLLIGLPLITTFLHSWHHVGLRKGITSGLATALLTGLAMVATGSEWSFASVGSLLGSRISGVLPLAGNGTVAVAALALQAAWDFKWHLQGLIATVFGIYVFFDGSKSRPSEPATEIDPNVIDLRLQLALPANTNPVRNFVRPAVTPNRNIQKLGLGLAAAGLALLTCSGYIKSSAASTGLALGLASVVLNDVMPARLRSTNKWKRAAKIAVALTVMSVIYRWRSGLTGWGSLYDGFVPNAASSLPEAAIKAVNTASAASKTALEGTQAALKLARTTLHATQTLLTDAAEKAVKVTQLQTTLEHYQTELADANSAWILSKLAQAQAVDSRKALQLWVSYAPPSNPVALYFSDTWSVRSDTCSVRFEEAHCLVPDAHCLVPN